jgi:hypothetical protein
MPNKPEAELWIDNKLEIIVMSLWQINFTTFSISLNEITDKLSAHWSFRPQSMVLWIIVNLLECVNWNIMLYLKLQSWGRKSRRTFVRLFYLWTCGLRHIWWHAEKLSYSYMTSDWRNRVVPARQHLPTFFPLRRGSANSLTLVSWPTRDPDFTIHDKA